MATRQAPGTRAKDSDRSDTCQVLDSALSEGQLSEHARDPNAPDPLTVSVYVSSDFGSGYIEMMGDGTVKQINYPSS